MLQTERVRIYELIVFDDTDRETRDFLPLNKPLQKRLQLLHVALISLGRPDFPTRSATGDQQGDEEDTSFHGEPFHEQAAGGRGEANQRHLSGNCKRVWR